MTTSFTFPESTTNTTSLIVILVSAMLVDRIWQSHKVHNKLYCELRPFIKQCIQYEESTYPMHHHHHHQMNVCHIKLINWTKTYCNSHPSIHSETWARTECFESELMQSAVNYNVEELWLAVEDTQDHSEGRNRTCVTDYRGTHSLKDRQTDRQTDRRR